MDSSSVLGLLLTHILLAQETAATVFQPPEDVILIWAKRIGLMMTVASVIMILYPLLFRRDRLGGPHSKWMLFFGLCVMPLPVLFLSNAVGLEQSKDLSFCQSCHVMQPFLSDMKDPDSDLLAARHYRNRLIQKEQCWTCHSDYGIFGTAQAKLGGLHDVYLYLTDAYELPIQLRQPYNFTICLGCHGESARFQQEQMHEDLVPDVVSGDIACTDCHEMAHPERETRSTEP